MLCDQKHGLLQIFRHFPSQLWCPLIEETLEADVET